MASKEHEAMGTVPAHGGEFSTINPPPGPALADDNEDADNLAADDDDDHNPIATAPPLESMDTVAGYNNVGFDAFLQPPPSYEAVMGEEPVRDMKTSIPRVTEGEAREALLEYVSQECCYGTGAARNLVFQELKHSDAFHYTMESFTESRFTAWHYVPYTGQFIDGPENGIPPAPWEVPVNFPGLFVDLVNYIEVPHTASVKPCHTCCATGRVICTKCRGKGKVRCTSCSGKGFKYVSNKDGRTKRDCPFCHRGKKRCNKCSGCGMITCRTCQGSTQLKCYIQLTVTWKNEVSHHILERTDLPDDLIKSVTGKVTFQEQQLRVWPISNFPEEEINMASRNLVDTHARDFSSKRIHMQRHSVQMVPVTQAMVRWKGDNSDFFIFGLENKIYAPNYPQQCCWGCSIL